MPGVTLVTLALALIAVPVHAPEVLVVVTSMLTPADLAPTRGMPSVTAGQDMQVGGVEEYYL